jgi:hypothetical protein
MDGSGLETPDARGALPDAGVSAAIEDDPLATPQASRPVSLAVDASLRREDAERLDEASFERRVFRQLLVGAPQDPATRLTWVLYRNMKRVRLDVFCQQSKQAPNGGRLDGIEESADVWLPPTSMTYTGAGGPDSRTYTLSAESARGKRSSCEMVSPSLTLECRPVSESVRAPGAILMPPAKLNSGGPALGRPASTRSLPVVRCTIMGKASPNASRSALLFAAPGTTIEWAYENSETASKEGAFREVTRPTGL